MRLPGVRWAGTACLLLVVSGCSAIGDVLGGGDAVLDTGIEPVTPTYEGPTYAALERAGGRELVVRVGSSSTTVRGVSAGWTPDGRALVLARGRLQLVDTASGVVAERAYFSEPSQAVTRINLVLGGDYQEPTRLRSYDLALEPVATWELPVTDDPAAEDYDDLERNYYGAVPTIDGTTYMKWHDSSESYEDGDYGVLRIAEDGSMSNVEHENVVGHYLAVDGAALLGLRQVNGEPCGGCVVDQDIVELDPETGEIAAEYGVPDAYTEDWRVAAVDKVGGRVAVRYYEADARPSGEVVYKQRGTWVYEDGDWTMVEGSTEELTWWQGDGRVVARISAAEEERQRGDGFDLFWVEGDTETPLPGELGPLPRGGPSSGSVAGQLLEP